MFTSPYNGPYLLTLAARQQNQSCGCMENPNNFWHPQKNTKKYKSRPNKIKTDKKLRHRLPKQNWMFNGLVVRCFAICCVHVHALVCSLGDSKKRHGCSMHRKYLISLPGFPLPLASFRCSVLRDFPPVSVAVHYFPLRLEPGVRLLSVSGNIRKQVCRQQVETRNCSGSLRRKLGC